MVGVGGRDAGDGSRLEAAPTDDRGRGLIPSAVRLSKAIFPYWRCRWSAPIRATNATITHPETCSKFQKQVGRVARLREMINWCIRNRFEGQDLAADDPKMIPMLAYCRKERRGVKLEPGQH